MRTAIRRIDKLENRLGIAAAKLPCTPVVVSRAGWGLALDNDTCVQILSESGFLPDGPFFALVDLTRIPHGLTAKELERFLRENGAEICGPRNAQNQGGPAGAHVSRGETTPG